MDQWHRKVIGYLNTLTENKLDDVSSILTVVSHVFIYAGETPPPEKALLDTIRVFKATKYGEKKTESCTICGKTSNNSPHVATDANTGEPKGAGYWYDDPYAEIDARQKAAYNNMYGPDIQLGERPTYEELSPEDRAAVCEKCGVILDPGTPIDEGQPVLCGVDRCKNEEGGAAE